MTRSRTSKSPELRQVAWGVALRLGTFGWAEINVETGISEATCKQIIREWEAAGAVQPIAGPKPRNMWTVDRDFVWPKERYGTKEDRMWLAMRKLTTFQPLDLAHHANSDDVPVTTEDASAYCQMLLAAGYLAVSRRAAPAMKRQAMYRLIRPTGIAAPVRRLVPALFDANTGALTVLEKAGQS